MLKLAAISPRTQSLTINERNSSPESQQFEQLFSERAHATLGAKSPELSASIINFKIVESDIDQDTASGIFICSLGSTEIHIPVVLSAGQVQAPEVFYSPMATKFFPLTSKFISFAEKTSTDSSLGGPIDSSIMDGLGSPSLSGITSPPQSMGKFSSYELPLLVAQVTDGSREKVSSFLKKNTKVLRRVVRQHGKSIINSLATRQQVKLASSLPEYKILTSYSNLDDFKTYFGPMYKKAYQEALTKGYAGIDFRKNAAELVVDNLATKLQVTEPGTTGIYKILKNDGKHVKALIITSPKNLGIGHPAKYLCILENGDYIISDKIAALETNEGLSESSVISSRLKSEKPAYRTGTVTYIKTNDGKPVNGTLPEKVTNFTTSKGSPLTCKIKDTPLTISFLGKSGGFSSPVRADNSDTAFVPFSYKPLYLKKQLSVDSFITSADVLRRALMEGMSKISSGTVKVKKTSGGWAVDGRFVPSTPEVLEKLASLGASIKSSQSSIKDMYENEQRTFSLIQRSNLTKIGSIFGPAAPSSEPMPPAAAQAPLPPGMMGPPPGMMGPPPGMMGDPSAGMMGPQGVPPEQGMMLETAADTGNPEVLDTALAAVLIEEAGMKELMTEYSPKLLEGLDSLCRILLTMQLNFITVSEQIGPEEYTKFVKKLTKSMHSLGDIVLTIVEGKSIKGGLDNASIQEY